MSMKIAMLHRSTLPARRYGGIERVIMNLATEFKALGHEVTLFANPDSQIHEFNFVPISREDNRPLDQLINTRFDIVHFHEPVKNAPPYPHLVSIHGNAQPGEIFLPNTCFCSKRHAQNHASTTFVYHGLDAKLYPFRKDKDDYFVFMAMGYLKTKNLKACVEWANDTKTKLKVIGGFGFKSKYVEHLGLLGDADGRLEILSRARGMLFPINWEEPFAIAPLEALACGTPVIGSLNGCMPEMLSQDTGVLCRDYSEMLQAKPKLELLKPEDCRRRIETVFSLRKMAEGYLHLYEKIITEKSLPNRPHYDFHPEQLVAIHKPGTKNIGIRTFYAATKLYSQIGLHSK